MHNQKEKNVSFDRKNFALVFFSQMNTEIQYSQWKQI